MMKLAIFAIALAAGCSKQQDAPAATSPEEKPAEKPASMNVDLLRSKPEHVLVNELVTYEPKEGHHFEVKAPQECGTVEPTEKTPRKVVCQLVEPGAHAIALNICDDAKTACKPVRYEVSATAPRGWKPNSTQTQVLQPPKHKHPPVEGFLINEPDEAQAIAKKEGKLLFVHFYGIWCPPCNMLEEHVYGEKAFLDATDGMVRVMLDADSDLSWAWKARFKVGGYPTVVIATPDLDEIDRLVGSKPVGPVVTWAKNAEAQRATPIAKLIADNPDAAKATPDVRKRVGLYFASRREWDDAVKWLAEHSDEQARIAWFEAQQAVAKRDADDATATRLTQRLAKEFPSHISFSSWVEELLEEKVPGAAELVEPALANLNAWKTSPKLGETGYGVADVWWLEADLRKATDDEEGAKKAYLESARLYGELAKSSSLEVARGANMERAYALHKAGDNEAAKALYEELSTAYADEFSFNYNFAHVLNELEERERAYEYAKRAEANAYGDNWLRAVHMRAKIENALGNKDAATKTIDDALAQAVIPRTQDVRTHGYVKRLRKLRDKIENPEPKPTE